MPFFRLSTFASVSLLVSCAPSLLRLYSSLSLGMSFDSSSGSDEGRSPLDREITPIYEGSTTETSSSFDKSVPHWNTFM